MFGAESAQLFQLRMFVRLIILHTHKYTHKKLKKHKHVQTNKDAHKSSQTCTHTLIKNNPLYARKALHYLH